MATIAIELGKLSSQKTREVYLLVRQGKTRRRVKTGVKLLETEISPKTGKIKSVEKAMAVEKLKCELQESMDALKKGTLTTVKADANTIAAKITRKKQENDLDFFAFAEKWLQKTTIKGAKNYKCMPPIQSVTFSALTTSALSWMSFTHFSSHSLAMQLR